MHVATTKCVPYLEDGKVNSRSDRQPVTEERRGRNAPPPPPPKTTSSPRPQPARPRPAPFHYYSFLPSPMTHRGDTAPTKEHCGVGGPAAAAAGRFESQFMRMNRATCSGEVEAYLPLIENNDSSFRRPTRPRSSVGPAPTLGARAGRDVYISDMKRRLNCGAKNNEQGQVGRAHGGEWGSVAHRARPR